ncbi:FliH/SctL family protein [Paraburkholderia hayleyella]|uniref:FliH/SctL family protein n=1 Tax=Paraburkholderia hayleyella TaxID=2152889 RepID=UPI0012908CA3|nr:FliH/SctL family protein [Paraburkholderia hayleyella]
MMIYRLMDWHVAGDGLVSRRDFETVLHLHELRLALEEQSHRERSQQKSRLRTLYREARARGYQAGVAAATRDFGRVSARTALTYRSLEHDLVSTVVQVTRNIIGRFSQTRLVNAQVRRALETVQKHPVVALHVSKQALPGARKTLRALNRKTGIELLTLVENPQLEADACIIEADDSIIYTSLEMQLEALCDGVQSAIDAHSAKP